MMKRNETNENVLCRRLQTKINSIKTIINSMNCISQKCQLFINELECKQKVSFNHNNQSDSFVMQLKKLIIKYNNELSLGEENETTNSGVYEKLSQNSKPEEVNSDNNSSIVASDAAMLTKTFHCCGVRVGTIRRYYCSFQSCSGNFDSRANLLAHLAKHTGEKAFICSWPGCGKSFAYQRSVDRHKEMVHLKKERFRCLWNGCNEMFVQKHQLDCHMSDCHTGEKLYKCLWPCCQFQTNYLHGLKTHQKTHSGEKNVICSWPACGKQFPYKRSLDRHMEVIHLRTTKYRCEWPCCDESFITKSQLDCHMTNCHTGQKQYKCEQTDCDFETNYLNHFKDHKLKHDSSYVPMTEGYRKTGNRKKVALIDGNVSLGQDLISMKTGRPLSRRRRPKNHVCNWPDCENRFESPNALEKHLRTHTGETPFMCSWPACQKKFRYKQTLKVHMEMVHLKLKQHKCLWPGCEAAFVSRKQLEVHSSDVHIGQKKYRCDWPECDWIGTNHSQELRSHKLRKHEGIGVKTSNKTRKISKTMSGSDGNKHIYSDQECGKEFKGKSLLTQNLRIDRIAGQKIYSCSHTECNKKFNNLVHLSSHSINDRIQRHLCDWPECNSEYDSKILLEQHVNADHFGHKSYAYPKHEISGKSFECQFGDCHKKFVQKRTLELHMRKKHNVQFDVLMDAKNIRVPQSEKSNALNLNKSRSQTNLGYMKYSLLLSKPDSNVNDSANENANDFVLDYETRSEAKFSSNNSNCIETNRSFGKTSFATGKQYVPHNGSSFGTMSEASSTLIMSGNSEDNQMNWLSDQLPNACTESGCWRRFRTQKALNWHLKKAHKTQI